MVALSAIGFAYFKTDILRITHANIVGDDPYREQVAAFVTSRMPFFFLSSNRIERELQKQFPRMKQLTFGTDVLNNNLEVSYTLREAHFLWCNNILQQACYLVDTHGIIFEKSDIVENTLLTKVEDKYFENVAIGKKIPLPYIETMKAFEETFSRRKLRLTKFTINAPFSLAASLLSGVEVRFSSQKEIKEQTEKLATFLSSQSVDKLSTLQYIDLRIEDRIYYK